MRGPGQRAFLDRICANEIDRPVGAVTYTQLTNERGGIECDLTVTRLDTDRFLLVTGTAFGNHDLGWIHKQQERLPEGDAVEARDVTSAWTPASGSGARRRVDPASPSPAPRSTTRLPLPVRAAARTWDPCPCWRCG